MADRFVRPDTVTLTLTDGDTLTVRKRLTAGQQRGAYRRMMVAPPDGSEPRLDRGLLDVETCVAYLVDWSFTEGGELMSLKGMSPDDVLAALDALDPVDYAEVQAAIVAHDNAIAAARKAERARPFGESQSSAT